MTQTTPSHSQAVELARRFHDAYERLAPQFGYITREDTRAFDPESSNGKLMTAVCAELTSQQEVAAPVSDDDLSEAESVSACLGDDAHALRIESPLNEEIADNMERAAELLDQYRAASRVTVASLASREQGVEAVGAVPVVAPSVQELAAGAFYPQVTGYTAPPSSKTQDDLAGAGAGGTRIIEPPEFAPRPSITDSMSKDDLWPYACLVGYRYELSEHDKLQSTLASQPKATAPVPAAFPAMHLADGVTSNPEWLAFKHGTLNPALSGGPVVQGEAVSAEQVLQAVQSCGSELSGRIALTYEGGPTVVAMKFARAIQSVLATPAPEQATTGSGQGVTDAERYQWLRNIADPDAEDTGIAVSETYLNDWGKFCTRYFAGDELDKAIDAAILSTASPAGEGEVKK